LYAAPTSNNLSLISSFTICRTRMVMRMVVVKLSVALINLRGHGGGGGGGGPDRGHGQISPT
jgi:hypothetical protein